jgi:GNAT superfamily N-acetyltransferase
MAMIKITATQQTDPEFEAFLLDGIVKNDQQHLDLPDEDFDLTLILTDAAGQRCGGVSAETYYGWMRIKLLFVPSRLRGQGIGARLLAMAEAEALRLDCVGVWLDTFSFQAPAYYQARGYVQFGCIADYPGTAQRCFMQKRFDQG